MNKTSSLVPVQAKAVDVVPKPTKQQIITVLTHELHAKRVAENLLRQERMKPLRKKMQAEVEKLKKKTIKLELLDCNWDTAGAFLYINGQSLQTTPKMQEINEEMKKCRPLPTNLVTLKEEVTAKIEKEMIDAIANQPGIKEAMGNAIVRLGL